MGGWTVRVMWSLHFGFGCSLKENLMCCQHMLCYSVWILTELAPWQPSLNGRQQRIMETSKSEFMAGIMYRAYCLRPLWCLTPFYLFNFDFDCQSVLLVLKAPQRTAQKDQRDKTKVTKRSLVQVWKVFYSFKMALHGGHLQMCQNMCIMD